MSPWVSFLIMLVMCFSFSGFSYARHRKHPHSPAVLVGTVYCDTCFRQEAPKSTHFLSGAKVAVECGSHGKRNYRAEVKTNENGEFEVKLPIYIGKNVEKIKGCSVSLISSGKPYCAVAATATSSEIRYKSNKTGTRIFSAGFFTFKPELCDQKDFTGKGFPPSLPDPPSPFLPPIGEGILPPLPDLQLPIPPLVPPLPRLPGIPLLPPLIGQKQPESNKLSDQKTFGFPPDMFKPPTLAPPVPVQPSAPQLPVQPSAPSMIPPIFPSTQQGSLLPPLPDLRVPLSPILGLIAPVPPATTSPGNTRTTSP